MRRRGVATLLLILGLMFPLGAKAQRAPSAAEKLDPAQSTTLVTTEEVVVPEKKNSYSVGASHNSGFYENNEPTTSLFASATRKLNKKQSLSIAQSFNQSYRVNPRSNDRGFSANDTVLGFNQNLAEDYLSMSWGAKLSTTLPVSERSKKFDMFTVSSLSLNVSRPFLDKRLSVSLTPMGRYYFSEYTTTPSTESSGGGNPLPRYLLGVTGGLNYKVSDKLSVSSSAGWSTQYSYRTQYENVRPEYGFTAPPKNSYSLSLGTSYEINKNWGVSLTYAHGDRYEKPWGVEYLVFNDRVTTWSIGANHNF